MRYLRIYINTIQHKMSLSQKIFTSLIILYPILNIYQSGIHANIGIGDGLMLAFLVIYMPNILKKKLITTDYLLFMVYIIVISFIDIVSINGGSIPMANLIRIVRHGFYGIVVCIYMPHYFNLQYGKSLMKITACIVSIGVVFQSILYYLFHKLQFFWLPVEAFAGGEIRSARMLAVETWAHNGNFRPSFVFVEPAGFSQYVIIGVLLFLFCEKREKRAIIGAGLCSLGILLSTSAGGICVMVLGWAVWLLKILKRIIAKGRIEKYICYVILFLMVTAIGILSLGGVGKMLIHRFSEISFNKGGSSGNQRVLRGFLIFFELNPWRKIFGLGLGNIDDYFTQMHMTKIYGDLGEYMNSLTYILNSAGIGGVILLLIVLIRRMFHRNDFLMALSLVVLAWSLGASIFNSGCWLIYMAFLIYVRKNSLKAEEIARLTRR